MVETKAQRKFYEDMGIKPKKDFSYWIGVLGQVTIMLSLSLIRAFSFIIWIAWGIVIVTAPFALIKIIGGILL